MMWYNHTNICDPQVNPVVMKDGILQRRITKRIMPEERIPKVKAEFVAAVIDDWKKKTAQEKLETRRGLFPL